MTLTELILQQAKKLTAYPNTEVLDFCARLGNELEAAEKAINFYQFRSNYQEFIEPPNAIMSLRVTRKAQDAFIRIGEFRKGLE
jgi:hypothetical protein